ncbi:hypothetical protein O181_100462 [Austropuccinia psidii MF-1]|uniref:Uncharacterized protein n=1 Tax=Austropuccinia psidii MF-1 TaxID=1389203 RepID=A0A9Q3JF97_9BASI|nr:hypothetical protein [Austropuccinia psidii MF-1]
MHPVLKVAKVVHIWYYVPSCTIFSQQVNGDVFRTKFHDSKTRSQNSTPISKKDSSAHQSGIPWQLSEDYSRTPTTWSCRSCVGISIQDYTQGPFLNVVTSFQSVVKAASTSASLGKLNWSIRVILKYHVWPWTNGFNSFPLWQFSPTVQFPRWPELYWPNSDNKASDLPSRISLSAFHIYWPPFSTWGCFPQNSFGFISFIILEPSKHTTSQARTQAVLTLTPRAPLDSTPEAPQLRTQLDRGPTMEGAAPSRKEEGGPRRSSSFSGVVGGFPGLSRTSLKVPGEDDEEEGENSVEEEESDGTEAAPAPVGAPQSTGRPTLSQSDQPVSHQSEPPLLAIMQQMTQFMANLQAAFSSE